MISRKLYKYAVWPEHGNELKSIANDCLYNCSAVLLIRDALRVCPAWYRSGTRANREQTFLVHGHTENSLLYHFHWQVGFIRKSTFWLTYSKDLNAWKIWMNFYIFINNLIWYVSLFLIGWKIASISVWMKKKQATPTSGTSFRCHGIDAIEVNWY